MKMYTVGSLSFVLLSVVPVTLSQLWSKNIKWEILEINNACFKSYAFLSRIMKSLPRPASSAQYIDHPLVQSIHTVYATC
jgi:hypothetical protein